MTQDPTINLKVLYHEINSTIKHLQGQSIKRNSYLNECCLQTKITTLAKIRTKLRFIIETFEGDE